MIHRGKYIGSIVHLQGKTALLNPGKAGKILAQFDDSRITLSGKPEDVHEILVFDPHARFPHYERVFMKTPSRDMLGFGWHEFDPSDFELLSIEA